MPGRVTSDREARIGSNDDLKSTFASRIFQTSQFNYFNSFNLLGLNGSNLRRQRSASMFNDFNFFNSKSKHEATVPARLKQLK